MSNDQIHSISRAIIVKDGYILLVYDPTDEPYHYYELNKNFYYLPGGHIEFKESAHAAILREIKEETGYESIVKRFLGVLEHAWSFDGDEVCCHTHEMNFFFEVNLKDMTTLVDILPQEEHVAMKWIKLSELDKEDIRPNILKKLIPKWLNSQDEYELDSTIKP